MDDSQIKMLHRALDIIELQQKMIQKLQNEIDSLKAEKKDDTFVDEKGTTWNRPTAWAYAKLCKANAELHNELDSVYEANEEKRKQLSTIDEIPNVWW